MESGKQGLARGRNSTCTRVKVGTQESCAPVVQMCWERGRNPVVGLRVQALERDPVRVFLAGCFTYLYVSAEDTVVTGTTSLIGRLFLERKMCCQVWDGLQSCKEETSVGCRVALTSVLSA